MSPKVIVEIEHRILTALDTYQAAHTVRTHPVYYQFTPFQFCTHRPSKSSFVFPASPDKTSYPPD